MALPWAPTDLTTDEPVGPPREQVRTWFRRADPAGEALVEGCEAFLCGRSLELAVVSGAVPPRWTWTNVLAHGTWDDVARVAGAVTPPRCVDGLERWWSARAYLAGEVLAVSERHRPFGVVQARAMRPLEAEVAAFTPRHWYQAGDWVRDALAALAPLTAWRAR